MRRLLGGLLVFAAFLTTAAVWVWSQLASWAERPLTLAAPQVLEYPPGTPLSRLSRSLASSGIIDGAQMFEVWVRLGGADSRRFKAGRYRFEGAVTPRKVAADLEAGRIWVEIVTQYTVPEGFTARKIADRLAANGVGEASVNLKLLRSASFAKSLGVPAPTLEGYLYPATYSFTEKPTLEHAVTKMVRTFFERLPKDYEARARAQGLSLHEAVTFASLIELETMHADEKPLVSEVVWRRLKANVPLGIDATIIYGIPDWDGNLRRKHLDDAKNPWNSRIHRGLPPSPIGSVTIDSLEAVLRPSNMGYWYYVLIPNSDGRHHFSKTLSEHNEHVRKLVRALQGSRGGSEKSP